MKRVIALLLFCASSAFADRLGSLRSAADVLLSTQGANSSSVIHSTDSLQTGSTFYVSSGTVAGAFYVNGSGNGQIVLTISGSTYTVTSSSSGSYSVGQAAIFSSTSGMLIGGTSGVAVGGSGTQLQYRVDATTLGGVPNTGVWASSVTFSTMSILSNAGQSANVGWAGSGLPGILDVFSGALSANRSLFNVGSTSRNDQFYIPNNHYVVAQLGIQAGQLIVGDTGATGQRIYSNGDNNAYIDLRNGSTGTWNTGTANGAGDIRLQPGGNSMLTLSAVTGVEIDSSVEILWNTNASLNTGHAGTGGAGLLDLYAFSPPTDRTLFAIGSSAQVNQLYVPNGDPVVATLGLQAGQLVVGDTTATGQRIYSFGDTNAFFDLRNGSSGTWNTGTANGQGDIRFQPASHLKMTVSNISGVTMEGVNISSGVNINIPSVITATSTITSSMTVVIASCTTRGASPNAWITMNLGSANNSGEEHFIYNVGADSCSIRIQAQGTDLIESTGTLTLDAQTQHASIHALGNGIWGAGPGGIQYTPWSIFNTQDDVAANAISVSSQVMSCPIYLPVPVGVTGFRFSRNANVGYASAAVTDMRGKYIVGVSTVTTINGPNSYMTGAVTQVSPGMYRLEFTAAAINLTFGGSNSVNSGKMFCSNVGNVGTGGNGIDLSKFTPTIPGTNNNDAYIAVDLIFNGGMQTW